MLTECSSKRDKFSLRPVVVRVSSGPPAVLDTSLVDTSEDSSFEVDLLRDLRGFHRRLYVDNSASIISQGGIDRQNTD